MRRRSIMGHVRGGGVVALIAALLVMFAAGRLADAAGPAPGRPAPAFAGTDTSGRPLSLADYRGSIVVLEWTNHECPFVRRHYDSGNMQALQEQARKDGVVWLTIVSSAPGEQGYVTGQQADALAKSGNATPTAIILDPSGEIGRAYGAKTTPHMFVIDPAGNVVYMGAIDDQPRNAGAGSVNGKQLCTSRRARDEGQAAAEHRGDTALRLHHQIHELSVLCAKTEAWLARRDGSASAVAA